MIEFMRFRYYAYGVSLLLLGLSVFLLFWKGLNLGLDFTGGTLMEVRFEKKVPLGEVRRGYGNCGIARVSGARYCPGNRDRKAKGG
jgi:preprotein translocase subunit SecF